MNFIGSNKTRLNPQENKPRNPWSLIIMNDALNKNFVHSRSFRTNLCFLQPQGLLGSDRLWAEEIKGGRDGGVIPGTRREGTHPWKESHTLFTTITHSRKTTKGDVEAQNTSTGSSLLH